MDYISPFAADFPDLPAIKGVRLSSAHTAMKYQNRDDIMLIELAEGTTIAGVFTLNSLCGEPIKYCRNILGNGTARAIIVNAGISNVFTGQEGASIVEDTAQKVAELIGCKKEEIYPSSTGVIGEQLDREKLLAAIPELYENLDENKWEFVARAFLTVDTFPKAVTHTAYIGATQVTINGIIKGSGMVMPNMATMLGYVFTDAKIPANVMQKWLNEDNIVSYSSLTVDSDTSTSDTILTLATGQVEHWEIKTGNEEFLTDFRQKLTEIHIELAKLVAKDGEGISKFLTVNIKNAESDEAARTIGKSVANSPLVKTAIAGSDANWGRIIMAIGKSGEKTNMDKTSIWIGDERVAEAGCMHPDYCENNATQHMKGKEIIFTIDVGVGSGKATIFGCDMTHEFIKINADYRT